MKHILMIAFVLLMGITNAFATNNWSNGSLEGGTFVWSNGGGDPYTGSLDYALQLAGIDDVRVRKIITNAVHKAPNGNAGGYTIQDGDRLGVMISGDGWVARNPVAKVSSWHQGRSRNAHVWYVTDPQTKIQYRLMKPRVCGNWLVEFFGAPEKCRCQVGRDAC